MGNVDTLRTFSDEIERPGLGQLSHEGSFRAPLPASLLNIDDKLRSSLFSRRGQSSPQLVESLLSAYAEPEMTVLDPFMGSGTVLVEAARHGNPVYGSEVNPAAFTIARLFEFCSVSHSARKRQTPVARSGPHCRSPIGFTTALSRDRHSCRFLRTSPWSGKTSG